MSSGACSARRRFSRDPAVFWARAKASQLSNTSRPSPQLLEPRSHECERCTHECVRYREQLPVSQCSQGAHMSTSRREFLETTALACLATGSLAAGSKTELPTRALG